MPIFKRVDIQFSISIFEKKEQNREKNKEEKTKMAKDFLEKNCPHFLSSTVFSSFFRFVLTAIFFQTKNRKFLQNTKKENHPEPEFFLPPSHAFLFTASHNIL